MSDSSSSCSGFTLIELMIVVAILGVLASVAVPQYGKLVQKSKEGITRGNLGQIRSSLSVYYSDNEAHYPSDDLTTLTFASKYIDKLPPVFTPSYHEQQFGVLTELSPTDTGRWSYNNTPSDLAWGNVVVGCTHVTVSGDVWTSF